ncbi:O-succinylhomoserine sulfhydrylase [Sinimarinibacterium sp. CAU 1509]|uniref:O-succinylhomoserine sulfhydrylase n=1 Tax=Sinimarinibacterium sp. CAU 1509 TaxID=2562283 RepID=UPI0010ABDF3B|nr:O-succinylhomoserine sulfhydrylase [Sinimarinibacterium sp. CAU 1509]TJY62249.1 O-succinylhomoserine sulfhydrylase [Sinimarinibacterium sp. CAU 1509]
MNELFDPDWGFSTLGIRAAEPRTENGEHSASVSLTSSYVFGSAAEAAAVFQGKAPGYIYSRFTNPTVEAFERRLAAMEGGESCVATASGMAAILTLCLSVLNMGDHIVASRGLFGSTINLFNNILERFGLSVSYVDMTDVAAWDAAMQDNTRLLFVETPSNPLVELADIAAIAEVAHRRGALLCVDNCFLTPVLQQPLKLGADFVIHSATKYLDGQGRCVGGAIVGDAQRVGKDVFGFMRTAGPCMSPFNAWVFLKGLETLSVRMKAHCENSRALAEWLEEQPAITRVFYPGLSSHPQHVLAQRQQSGYGAIVSFELDGGRDAAWKLIDSTRMISITANLGDTRTTITHPATTTHGRITAEARAAAGITEGLVRIAVGLEDIADIQADLARGLV